MAENEYEKALKGAIKRFPGEISSYLQKFLSSTPLPVIVSDPELNIVAASEVFCNKLSLGHDELIRKKFNEILPDSFSHLKKAISRLTDQVKTEIKNLEFKDAKGKTIATPANISVFSLKNTRLVIIYLTRMETRKENFLISETGKLDNFLYEQTQRGKLILDTEKRILYGSPICFTLFGLKTRGNSVDFRDILDLIASKEERDNFEKDILRLKQHPVIVEKEIRLRTENQNNTIRHIRLIMNRFDAVDKNLIAGTADDITEFKSIEKDLFRSRARVEKADRFKSVFLTNLSHEIRTPMNAILGYSELLNHQGLKTSEISEYTSIIRSKGNYLLTLIDDVIELSRFESGNIEFNYKEFQLLPLLKELYREFDERRVQKGKTSINLELIVPENAEEQNIYTDYGRLQQILSNLLSNALKFTERGEVKFGFRQSSKNFKFFVSDTGTGLSPEDQKKIFNRFETIEETTIKKLSGTGLSLTISKLIVEQLGGKIKVKSEINKGSRFQVNIPIINSSRRKVNLAEEHEYEVNHKWKDKVILIAEDEDVNFRFLDAVLQKTQAQILRARNGQEAIDLCKNINQIDIVLMDIKMPIVNGYDAIIDIKRYRTNLPIIAQTAFSSQEEINKCQQVGCDDYVTKPIDINLLINKINRQFLK